MIVLECSSNASLNKRETFGVWLLEDFKEGKARSKTSQRRTIHSDVFHFPGQSLIMWADPVLAASSVRDINSTPLCVFPGHFSLVNQAVQVCSTSIIPAPA